jgi:hypothetical protein
MPARPGRRGVDPKGPQVSVGDYRPLPLERFPELARAFIGECAESIGCDPAFVALPLLSTLAAAVGTTRRIRLKRGGHADHAWTEPCALWTAIVAESGSHKTPAMLRAVKMANDADAELGRKYEEEMREYERAKLGFQSKAEAWAKSRRGDKDAEQPEEPKKPPNRALVVKNTTIEAIAPLLQDNPRGLLVAPDELGGFVASFDRYAKSKGGGELQQWLELHSAGDLKIDRKTGVPSTIRVRGALVSITGGIQPGILRRIMGRSQRDSGFAARFLMAMPPQRPRVWSDSSIREATWNALARAYQRLRSLKFETEWPEARYAVLDFGPGAFEEWLDFYNRNGAAIDASEGDRRAAYSKIEAAAARISLLFALLRWAGGPEGTPEPREVDAESVRDGCALADWFREEADRVYGIFETDADGGDADGGADDRVLAFLGRAGPSTERDIRTKAGGGFQRRGDIVKAALRRLQDEHREDAPRGVTVANRPASERGGRPTLVYALPSSPCSCAYCENRRNGILGAPSASGTPEACGYREDCGELIEAWRNATSPAHLEAAARTLGVSADALRALGFAWCPEGLGSYAFPMHDESGRVCGIRLRAPVDAGARKWAVKGSRPGGFCPIDGCGAPADRVFVCEGPTDAAALLGVRDPAAPERPLAVIGRPSCSGQEEIISRIARSFASEDAELVIVADGDGAGRSGAAALAAHLGAKRFRVRTVTPPAGFKDARAWLRGRGQAEAWGWLSGSAIESEQAEDGDECPF